MNRNMMTVQGSLACRYPRCARVIYTAYHACAETTPAPPSPHPRPRPLRAQPQDNPTAANCRPRPAARAYTQKEAGPGSAPQHVRGEARAQRAQTRRREKTGWSDRGYVVLVSFARRQADRERPRSRAFAAYPRPAACLLSCYRGHPSPVRALIS